MDERIQRLQDIFDSLGATPTFTERQEPARGAFPDDAAVDERLRAAIAALRAESGFRTALSETALVTIVRGYYRGDTDAELATALDATPEQVARARVNLHLFRPADTETPVDRGRLRALLREGASVAAAATELDAPERQVRRLARVLTVLADASRSGYRYPAAYEDALGIAEDDQLAAGYLRDRRTMDEVVD